MSYKLFLDDVRDPFTVFEYTGNPTYCDYWKVVRNYDEFVQCIMENGKPDTISFDHDLADIHYGAQFGNINSYNDDRCEERTGFHCAKWFINHFIDLDIIIDTEILIHSINPVGAENIRSLFNTYNKIFKS